MSRIHVSKIRFLIIAYLIPPNDHSPLAGPAQYLSSQTFILLILSGIDRMFRRKLSIGRLLRLVQGQYDAILPRSAKSCQFLRLTPSDSDSYSDSPVAISDRQLLIKGA
jgi:hypothetical protein